MWFTVILIPVPASSTLILLIGYNKSNDFFPREVANLHFTINQYDAEKKTLVCSTFSQALWFRFLHIVCESLLRCRLSDCKSFSARENKDLFLFSYWVSFIIFAKEYFSRKEK